MCGLFPASSQSLGFEACVWKSIGRTRFRAGGGLGCKEPCLHWLFALGGQGWGEWQTGWGGIAQCLSLRTDDTLIQVVLWCRELSCVTIFGFNRALNRSMVTKSTPRNDLVLPGGQSHLWVGTTGLV